MQAILILLIIMAWAAIAYLWYRQRNMVTSKRNVWSVELHDKKGKINTKILE